MKEIIKDQLAVLIHENGEEAVKAAAAALLGKADDKPLIPTAYMPVIAAEKLHDTVLQLDASAQDIISKAQGREAVYGEKLSLLKRKRELETQIELREAEAIMSIRGESRSQYAMIGEEKVPLANEEARKAFAKTSAKEERLELAKVDSELAQIEQRTFWAKDEYEAAVKAGDQVQAKAYVQAGLLNMLAGRK